MTQITWFSAPRHAPTGYGQQTRLHLDMLTAAGHEIQAADALQWSRSGPPKPPPAPADVLVMFGDAWIMARIAKAHGLPAAAERWLFMMVDCYPLSQADADALRQLRPDRIFAPSAFGVRQLAGAGRDATLMPLLLDPAFTLNSRPRATPPKIVAVNAANVDEVRKGVPEMLLACRDAGIRDVRMHVAAARATGLGLDRLISACGMAGRVTMTTGPRPVRWLANWYAAADRYLAGSYAEGFCVPLIEAQVCGTPVVATTCSAMIELVTYGRKVTATPFWNSHHGAWWARPDIGDMARQLLAPPAGNPERLPSWLAQFSAAEVSKLWEKELN